MVVYLLLLLFGQRLDRLVGVMDDVERLKERFAWLAERCEAQESPSVARTANKDAPSEPVRPAAEVAGGENEEEETFGRMD